MTDERQAIDDDTPINPNTGLPKHIYHYNHNHPHCVDKSIRGTFQYKGKKYHTVTFYYCDGHLDDAIDLCIVALEFMKDSTEGYREYVVSGGYREKARQRAKNEYANSVHAKDDRATSASVESVCDKDTTIIRHIDSDGGVQ